MKPRFVRSIQSRVKIMSIEELGSIQGDGALFPEGSPFLNKLSPCFSRGSRRSFAETRQLYLSIPRSFGNNHIYIKAAFWPGPKIYSGIGFALAGFVASG
jgi:hypothetical protein